MAYYYYPPAPPPRPQLNPVDKVLTWLLCATLAAVAGLGFMWSLFGMMVTDRCSRYSCSDALIGAAYLIAWGGIALAGMVTYLEVRAAVARRGVAFIWPALGLVITVAGLVCGALVLNAAVGL